jgi:hypothetical protein
MTDKYAVKAQAMKIFITQEIIDKSARRSNRNNPVSVAMTEAGFTDTWCTLYEYGGTDSTGVAQCMRTPPHIVAWIQKHRKGEAVTPTQFYCFAPVYGSSKKPHRRRNEQGSQTR